MKKTTLPYALTVLALALTSQTVAAENRQQTVHAYAIPAGTLNEALTEFADQSNIKLVFNADLARNLKAPALHEKLSVDQGLNSLLKNSGLVYRLIDNNTAMIEPKPTTVTPKPQSATTLAPVNVTATAVRNVTDPYNKDYVLPNATSGTKTDTPIMETPLNIQVISKQVLKDQQVVNLGDALKNVSGVTTTTNIAADGLLGGTQQSIFLRGFESQTFFRNGFRLQQGSASKGMANVESVEVLKGPAAILYGLVEPGGMVNVITKQPLATPYYGLTQQFGSYDLYRTTVDATGPIAGNKDVLYRMNLSYENSGSFRNLVDKENVFLAPVLKWNISPKTQVTFEMEYNHQHQGTDSGFIPFINGSPLNTPFSRNYGEYSPATTETIFGGFNWSHQFDDDWSIKHRFSVNQNSVTSPFYTRPQVAGTKAFVQGLLDSFGVGHPALDALPDGSYVWRDSTASIIQNNTYSTNLDLIGHFGTYGLKHTLLIGSDYYRLDFKAADTADSNYAGSYGSYISLNNPVHPGTPFGSLSSTNASTTTTDQYGLYIQDQIKLPYGFQVMGGIRYQYIHQASSSQNPTGATTVNAPSTQDAVTPRVGILWQPKSWLSLYANYVESFGANQGLVWPSSSPVLPTSSAQYEGGLKTQFFDGKLRATLAYYELTKTNMAVTDLNTSHFCGGGGVFSCSLSLGEVRSRGPELDITGEIMPGWNMIVTWSNTDIIVTKTNANNDPINGNNVGSRLPNVPRNTGSLWNTYAIQNGNYKDLTFGGGVTLRDGMLPSNDQNLGTASYKVPGYATFDLMTRYSRNVGAAKVSIQLNVNNLLDKRYLSSMSTINLLQGAWVDFGQPRTLMGQISVQY